MTSTQPSDFNYILNVFVVLVVATLLAIICTFSVIGFMNGYVYLVELLYCKMEHAWRRLRYTTAKVLPVQIATVTTLPTTHIASIVPTQQAIHIP